MSDIHSQLTNKFRIILKRNDFWSEKIDAYDNQENKEKLNQIGISPATFDSIFKSIMICSNYKLIKKSLFLLSLLVGMFTMVFIIAGPSMIGLYILLGIFAIEMIVLVPTVFRIWIGHYFKMLRRARYMLKLKSKDVPDLNLKLDWKLNLHITNETTDKDHFTFTSEENAHHVTNIYSFTDSICYSPLREWYDDSVVKTVSEVSSRNSESVSGIMQDFDRYKAVFILSGIGIAILAVLILPLYIKDLLICLYISLGVLFIGTVIFVAFTIRVFKYHRSLFNEYLESVNKLQIEQGKYLIFEKALSTVFVFNYPAGEGQIKDFIKTHKLN
jgi:hypothetical protein